MLLKEDYFKDIDIDVDADETDIYADKPKSAIELLGLYE